MIRNPIGRCCLSVRMWKSSGFKKSFYRMREGFKWLMWGIELDETFDVVIVFRKLTKRETRKLWQGKKLIGWKTIYSPWNSAAENIRQASKAIFTLSPTFQPLIVSSWLIRLGLTPFFRLHTQYANRCSTWDLLLNFKSRNMLYNDHSIRRLRFCIQTATVLRTISSATLISKKS